MTALTAPRPTPEAVGNNRVEGVAAATKIFVGAMIARNSAGLITKGQTATGLIGAGVAFQDADNSLGLAGAVTVSYKVGTFRFDNSAGADELTAADIGKVAWMVDDQTVARTSATNTRSRAGIVKNVDAQGVWIEFNEAVTAVATAAAA